MAEKLPLIYAAVLVPLMIGFGLETPDSPPARNRWPILLAAVAALGGILTLVKAYQVVEERNSPRRSTEVAMRVLSSRVMLYARENGSLPDSIDDLPKTRVITNSTNFMRDAWGHRLVLETAPPTGFSLRSLGRDGAPGGTGEDADILLLFPVTNALSIAPNSTPGTTEKRL